MRDCEAGEAIPYNSSKNDNLGELNTDSDQIKKEEGWWNEVKSYKNKNNKRNYLLKRQREIIKVTKKKELLT